MSDTVTITIDGFAHGGDGVGRLDGKAVFVPGALPGETVTVTLTENRRRYARGRLDTVLIAAADRVEPPCPYVSDCGGCDLQHVSPDGQAALKRRVVTEQLARLGGVSDPPVTDVIRPGEPTGYRAQARLQVAANGRLGFFAGQSHTVVEIPHCVVLNAGVQQARDMIGDAPGAASVTIRSFTPGDAAVTLEPADTDTTRFAATRARLTETSGLQVATQPADAPLTVTVGTHTFTVPSGAFFQASAAAAQAISDTVLAQVGGLTGRTIVDLYAGIGLFSVPLAAGGAQVTAVEANRVAAAAARTNTAGLPVTVVAKTVERFLDTPATFDVVVLDPPRSGAGSAVIDRVVGLKPTRIVYVACDPAALARDTRLLAAHGFTLATAVPIDAFPMTHHIEVVAAFDRQ